MHECMICGARVEVLFNPVGCGLVLFGIERKERIEETGCVDLEVH